MRQDNWPGVIDMETRNISGLDLEDSKALIETAHFVIHGNYMAMEFNKDAPRVTIIPPYVKSYFHMEVDYLAFLPIMKEDPSKVINDLLSLSSITFIERSQRISFADDMEQDDLNKRVGPYDRVTNRKSFIFEKKHGKEDGALKLKEMFTINLLNEYDDIILNGKATSEKLKDRSLKEYKERDEVELPVINAKSGVVKASEAYNILVDLLKQRKW
ncbi:MAG: hypothetical protein AAF975_00015 [Spirochaetota bacterium]